MPQPEGAQADPDELIRAAARAGERERVAGLLLRHYGPTVLGKLKRRAPADAEDAFQEAAVALVERLLEEPDAIRNIEGYFLAAAIYQAERMRSSFWGKLFRRAREPDDVAGDDPRHDRSEADAFDLEAALDALDVEQRVVLQMRLQGMSHEEIARCLRKSVDAVMQIASRATKRLRKLAAER